MPLLIGQFQIWSCLIYWVFEFPRKVTVFAGACTEWKMGREKQRKRWTDLTDSINKIAEEKARSAKDELLPSWSVSQRNPKERPRLFFILHLSLNNLLLSLHLSTGKISAFCGVLNLLQCLHVGICANQSKDLWKTYRYRQVQRIYWLYLYYMRLVNIPTPINNIYISI